MNLPRGGWVGLGSLLLVLGLPALASAQLFPNLPIRRERPDCSHENPQYRMIRQEYWGYYPTCWRRFPAGWGCPSPEAPNWEEAQRKLPVNLGTPPSDALPDGNKPMTTDPAFPEEGAKPGDTNLPALPSNNVSPFEPSPAPTPGSNPSAPASRPASPFEDPPAVPPGASTAPGLAPPADAPPTALGSPPRPRRGFLAGRFGPRR